MSDQFIGEIRPFAFSYPPRGWAACDGALIGVSQNNALFAVLGSFGVYYVFTTWLDVVLPTGWLEF